MRFIVSSHTTIPNIRPTRLRFGACGAGRGTGKPVTVNVSVTGATMNPATINVHQGDQVTMNLTVDKKEEIHLHGYDIKFEAEKAGDTVTHKFTADKTGNFDIEIEETGTGIGSLMVQPG